MTLQLAKNLSFLGYSYSELSESSFKFNVEMSLTNVDTTSSKQFLLIWYFSIQRAEYYVGQRILVWFPRLFLAIVCQ